jgi:hypothetical protein
MNVFGSSDEKLSDVVIIMKVLQIKVKVIGYLLAEYPT